MQTLNLQTLNLEINTHIKCNYLVHRCPSEKLCTVQKTFASYNLYRWLQAQHHKYCACYF